MSLYTPQMEAHAQAVEAYLPRCVPHFEDGRVELERAMRYALEGGGKRLRAVLLLEWYRVCGGTDVAQALPFAVAMEMVHAYSLVHDDLPCMDNSPLRRGKPSTHAQFGESVALLAGAALLTLAFEQMLSAPIAPAQALAAAGELAIAAGLRGMCGGQMLDLQGENSLLTAKELERLQRGKTAALIAAACVMGAHLAGADGLMAQAAGAYGVALGLCFQVTDDLLDATGNARTLGKPVGADAAAGKSTWVTLLGVEGARARADAHTHAATATLVPLGEAGRGLDQLAQKLRERKA